MVNSRRGPRATRDDAAPGAIKLTIDVHIRRLRQKLGACGGCVETVVGVGYRFNGCPAGGGARRGVADTP